MHCFPSSIRRITTDEHRTNSGDMSMKKISIAFLVAAALVSFGCKKGGGAGNAIAKMTEFKDKMCACKDKACTEKVTEEMTKWGQEQAKSADKDMKMSEEDS